MRPLALLFILFVLVHAIQAQENPRMELRHIRLEEAMSQHDFAMSYNICWEQVHQHLYHREVPVIPAELDLYFPPDILPCYNEAGQRLIFYENGESLMEPYYTDMRVYVAVEGETMESLTRAVNVCVEELVPQNEHFYDYYSGRTAMTPQSLNFQPVAGGRELFVPDRMPCYDEEGRKLFYGSDGVEALDGDLYLLRIHELYNLHFKLNTCPEAILAANNLTAWPDISSEFREIVVPRNAPDCYRLYRAEEYRPEALAQMHGICLENVSFNASPYNTTFTGYYYVRLDAPHCDNPLREDITGNFYLHRVESTSSIGELSQLYNVCQAELLAANGNEYPQLGHEYFIPKTYPCYDEQGQIIHYQTPIPIQAASTPSASSVQNSSIYVSGGSVQRLAWSYNVCEETLLAANPELNIGEGLHWSSYHYDQYSFYTAMYYYNSIKLETRFFDRETWVFIPQNTEPCYEFHPADSAEGVWSLAQDLNICIEQLLAWQYRQNEQDGYMIPYEREACYDENGWRLSYFDESGDTRPSPIRLENEVYTVPYAMSTYQLSRNLNICVNDLLALNYVLTQRAPYEHLEIFLPDTPPCYDEETGKQLIYTDANGTALDDPQLSEYLIHEVTPHTYWSTVTILYNVCYNRLLDFNEGFLPNVWTISPFDAQEYVADADGFFEIGVYIRIPTDRPPCFDFSDGYPRFIRYVCYQTPVDMSQENPDAVINSDGQHCYDIQDPSTVIWHNGDRYLYQVREGYLYTNEFMAWCFGVELSNIIAEAENEIAYIWPYAELLVRNPGRLCYAREYDGQENVHWVTEGETLRSIAWQYGKLPQWLAEANGLTNPDIIWEYQRLVIPEGINLWDVAYTLSGFIGLICLGGIGRFLLKRRALSHAKKKRKAETDKTKV